MTPPLRLLDEPNSYGAETRPPAPAWLIEGTPGAPALATTLDEAIAAAGVAYAAYSAAIRRFREASYRNADNEWAPIPSIAYDEWRDLKSAVEAGRVEAEYRSPRPVKVAWHALRDHIEASDEAATLARAVADERLAKASAVATELAELVTAHAEAATLLGITPSLAFDALRRAAHAFYHPVDRRPWRMIRVPADAS